MKKMVDGVVVDMDTEEIIQFTLNQQKDVPAHLSFYRYQKEVGGISINGIQIQTDRETRSTLIGARVIASTDPTYTVKWKTPTGFVELDAATIIAISNAVAKHVENCYAAEAIVSQNILTLTSTAEVEAAFDTAYTSQI